MRKLVIVVVTVIGILVLSLGVVAIIGSQLPVAHSATRSIVLHKSSAEIYALISDVAHASSWRSDLKNVELLGTPNGRLNYREHGKQGDVTYEVVEDVPGQRIVTRIVDKDLGYSGSWTTVLTPENGGTRVAITENGEVTNVVFRFMSRYVFGQTSTIDGYLASLAKRFNENVTPN